MPLPVSPARALARFFAATPLVATPLSAIRLIAVALVALPFVAGCVVATTPGPAYPTAPLEWNVSRPGSDYRSFDMETPSPETCQATCMNEPQCAAFTYTNPGVQGPNARCWLKSAAPPPINDGCCVSGTKYAGPPPAPEPAPAPPAPEPTPPPPASGWQGTPPQPAPPASGWQGTPTTPPPPPPPQPAPPASGWQGTPTTPPPPRANWAWEPRVDRPGADYRSFELREPRPEVCRDECWREGQCRAFTYVRPGVQGPLARCALKSAVPPARPNDCCVSGVK